MNTSNFIVRIPEPCHEDWNVMLPDEKGKFCNSCSKSVFDFSNKTDSEIKDVLIEHKGQKVCGHFKKSQIDRPLNIKVDLNNLPKNLSITKAFAIALFLVFGTILFSCTNEKGQKLGEMEVENFKPILGSLELSPIQHAVNDSLIIDTLSSSVVQPETILCAEETVAGGIGYEEVLVYDVPEAVKEEAIVDYVVLGGIGIEYIEFENPENNIDSANIEKVNESRTALINANKLEVYPNPTSGEFTVKYNTLKKSDVRLNIFDVNGSLVKEVVTIDSQYEGKYQIPVNLSDLPNGIYIVNLISNGERTTERVVIVR